jgi:hypothetical protein
MLDGGGAETKDGVQRERAELTVRLGERKDNLPTLTIEEAAREWLDPEDAESDDDEQEGEPGNNEQDAVVPNVTKLLRLLSPPISLNPNNAQFLVHTCAASNTTCWMKVWGSECGEFQSMLSYAASTCSYECVDAL